MAGYAHYVAGLRHTQGHLTVRFRKRNGGSFIKRFRSRTSKARAIRAWRSKGGKIVSSY